MKKNEDAYGAEIGSKFNGLAFADEIAIIAERIEDNRILIETFPTEADKTRLPVNLEKTLYMKVRRPEQ